MTCRRVARSAVDGAQTHHQVESKIFLLENYGKRNKVMRQADDSRHSFLHVVHCGQSYLCHEVGATWHIKE